MIAIIRQGTSKEQIEKLTHWIEAQGLSVHLSAGEFTTIVGLIGDTSKIDEDLLRSLDIVEAVRRISEPFKSANRKFHPEDSVINVDNTSVGGDIFAVMAGPCSVESKEQVVEIAKAVKAAGAKGVMLNHAEKPLDMETLEKTIRRADEVGLATIVCADTVEDVKRIAHMAPNLIVAEPTELIGTGTTSDSNYVIETIKTVNEINPDIMVLQGAGISNGEDVYNTIKLGAQATGSTSGILKAADPYAMVEEMLYNLRRAWNELHP